MSSPILILSTHYPEARSLGDPSYTGQKVPISGWWQDQHRCILRLEAGEEFPPCFGRDGQMAVYRYAGPTPTWEAEPTQRTQWRLAA